MKYFKICDEGFHKDWGGDPTYWLEVNDEGDAERQLDKYPNGNVVSYNRTHTDDEHGALSIMVIDGDEEFWIPYEISKIEFEVQWLIHRPLNRQLFNTEINSIKSWIIGQTFSAEQIYTQADFDEFARLSGDDNPIHVDPAFAARTGFGRTVAHGMLLYGTICGLLSRHFPGAVQLEQSFMFPAPTFADEMMTVQVEITAVDLETGQIRLKTTMTNPEGQLTCDGETILEWKDVRGHG